MRNRKEDINGFKALSEEDPKATVPVRNSYRLKEKPESLGIQTEVESWPEEVIKRYDDNLKDQEY